MRKFLRVAFYEYTNGVLSWGFLLGLLSLPFFALVFGLVIIIAFLPEFDLQPVGYVDLSGALTERGTPPEQVSSLIRLIPFESEAQAGTALEAGQIQAYYVLEADYEQSSQARLVARNNINYLAHILFTNFVRANLLADQPERVARRIENGTNLSVRAMDGSRQTGQGGFLGVYLPAVTGFVLLFIGFNSSGYLMSAIMEERTNRTLEMLVTTASSLQLVGGKTVGLLSVSLTQMLVWISPLVLLFALRPGALLRLTTQLFPPASLGMMLLTFVPTLILLAGLMMAIGAVSADYRDAQIIISLLFLPLYASMLITTLITKNPDSPLAVALSFFPLMSPIIVSMRVAVMTIPIGQAALIVLIQALFALIAIWLANRAWRVGLWNPRWRISFRHIFSRPLKLQRKSQPSEDTLP